MLRLDAGLQDSGHIPSAAHYYIVLQRWVSVQRCIVVPNHCFPPSESGSTWQEDVIGLSVTHPTWARTRPDDDSDKHVGWQFKVHAQTASFGSLICTGARRNLAACATHPGS